MSPPRSEAHTVDALLESGELAAGKRSFPRASRPRTSAQSLPEALQPQRQRRIARSRIEIVRASGWDRWPWLVHGFSTRSGGVTTAYRPGQRSGELNLGFTSSDEREKVSENRARFLQALGVPATMPLVTLKQIHSSSVVPAARAASGSLCQGDGLMTVEPGLLLAIQTADCIPVLVADVKRRAVAAFHAGWRGTVKRIVEAGIGRMRVAFDSRPEELVAAIGPGIGACCYAVGEEVRSEFTSQFAYAPELFFEVSDSDPIRERYPMLFLTARAPGHSNLGPSLHLDLMEANLRQLLDAGLRPEAITVIGDCTRCQNNRYFSYRAEQGFTGRMLSAIGIRG